MSSQNIDTRTRILQATWQLLEQRSGQDVSMSAIAKATGISRQALYLHFASRTELMIATTLYVDEVKGLNGRLEKLASAGSGVEMLDRCVEIWGNYIPEIYGIAKALMRLRDTDEAAAAAWNGSMNCLREVCRDIIHALEREGRLALPWSATEAVDLLWTMLSIENWEQLTRECGWAQPEYIIRMKKLSGRALVKVS